MPGQKFDGTTCSNCGIGRFSTVVTNPFPRTCSLCPIGQYTNEEGTTACSDCDVGKLSSSDRTFCADCVAGQYTLNKTSCENCEAGKYAPQALENGCLACGNGQYSTLNTGSTSCTACDSGSYNADPAHRNCTLCEPGRAQSASSQTSCGICEAGKSSQLAGSTTCSSCASGKVRLPCECILQHASIALNFIFITCFFDRYLRARAR